MVDIATALRLAGGVVLLFGNGFFVTTEFALTRVRQFDESQSGGLSRAWEMTEELENTSRAVRSASPSARSDWESPRNRRSRSSSAPCSSPSASARQAPPVTPPPRSSFRSR